LYGVSKACKFVSKLNEWAIKSAGIRFPDRKFDTIDDYLRKKIEEFPEVMRFCKYGFLLPLEYQVLLLKERQYDFNEAVKFLKSVRIIERRHLLDG
jgi:hypothetical protein